jgi:hypothetical protein
MVLWSLSDEIHWPHSVESEFEFRYMKNGSDGIVKILKGERIT